MIPRLGWWTALAALTPAMFVLSSCAGGNWSTLPISPAVSHVASVGALSIEQPHIAILNGQPNVTCPKRYLACVTVSQSTGAQIISAMVRVQRAALAMSPGAASFARRRVRPARSPLSS